MKKVLILLAILCVAIAVVVMCPDKCPYETSVATPKPAKVSAPKPLASPTGQPPVAALAEPPATEEGTQRTKVTEATPIRPDADTPIQPKLSPQQALETLRVTFKNYGQRFKGNPVGNNREITAALNGKNPAGARYLGEDPLLNEKGELVDGWGTPYFFHQLGGYDMEIHSAGPDRKMWTADDLVTR